MWTTEHSIETAVARDAIWRAWAEVPRWPEWNGDIERVKLTGPFATGSLITMTPHGQNPAQLRIADVVEGEQFGPAITADFDDTLKALIEHAGR